MGKCPYCEREIHIEDFFLIETKETKKGKIKTRIGEFKGEEVIVPERVTHCCKMWVCPSCDAILGFTEYAWSTS